MSTTTFPAIIERTRTELNTAISSVNGYASELDQLRQQPAPDTARVAELRELRARAEGRIPSLRSKLELFESEAAADELVTRAQEERHSNAERYIPVAHTSARSATYNERNQQTFLQDVFAWSYGGLHQEASQRLLTHEQESRAAGLMSERAGTTSGFAGIIPPQYLIEQYALVARAGRPVANSVGHLKLPATGMSLQIPKGTTGVSTGVQTAENTVVSTTDEAWNNVNVPVVTIAGYNPISRQSIDRAEGVDQIVFGDLAASYAVSLDQQVLTGTGTGGQALGILNTAGTSQATAFGAAVTVATFYSKLMGQINAVQTTRFFAPNLIVMHPRRWNWLMLQLDTSNRPLVTPEANGPNNAYAITTSPIDTGSADAVGSIGGVPVVTDASIPITLGTGGLEDIVIVTRANDLLLWEDDAAPFTLKFEQTLGTALTVTLVAYGYAAFTAGRFPTAVGLVGGNATTSGYGLTTVVF